VKHASRPNLLWIFVLPFSVLALGMILYHPLPSRQPAPTEDFKARLGAQAFASGDMQQAITLLSQAATGQVLSPEGWLILGDAYWATDDPANALRAWQNADAATGAVEMLNRRLSAHRQLRDYTAAIADLQALNTLQPDEEPWTYWLGLTLAATQPDQAVPYLEHLATASTSAYKAPASTLLDRIRSAQPVGIPAYTQLEAGRALADLNEWELAAEAFQRAIQLRPDYAEAWAFRGEALQHIDIPEGKRFSPAGLAELNHAIQLAPDSLSASLFLELYWRRQGQFTQALETLQNLVTFYPDNAWVQIELGNTLAESNDLKEALPYYIHATELAPTELDSWLALAGFSVRYQYQVRQVALPAARQLILLSPTDPAALDLMGQALFLLDDPLNAGRFYRRAIQVDYKYAPAHLHLAQVYVLRGENTTARQEAELARELAPGSVEAEYAQRLLESSLP
jgi:tetratricopeptide (TPR) repeat protein